ncbi:MAG TPA: nucleotide exchange factor GrpE [Acidimicrobiales bacterium]|nr:nucleotide exchange factor GrpE [Acidimicrobiales bacterium]
MTDETPDPDEELARLLDGELGDAPAEQPPVTELTVEALVADLERVIAERDRFLDGLQRTQADLENHKKQSQRRLADEVERRVGSFAEALLPVLDACDAALAHGATEVEPVATALLLALEKEGLTRLDPSGQPFDPTVAEAVLHEPGDGGEPVVSEVLRPGYAWQGRVLRPATVKVTD